MKTWRFYICITVNRQEYYDNVYLSLHLIANKTLELVYENAQEYTILKWKKNQKFSGEEA